MVKKLEQQAEDLDSLFDFLNDGEAGDSRETQKPTESSDGAAPAFPTIRKPVPVAKSGALRAPAPGDPVETPPSLTDGIRQANSPEPLRKRPKSDDYRDPLDGELDFLNDMGGDDSQFDRVSTAGLGPRSDIQFEEKKPKNSTFNRILMALGIFLLLSGSGLFAFDYAQKQGWSIQDIPFLPEISGLSNKNNNTVSSGNTPQEESGLLIQGNAASESNSSDVEATAETPVIRRSSLNARFTDQLEQLNSLVAAGSLDEAEQVLRTMDRTLYGYGAPEFTQLEVDIKALRDQSSTTSNITSNITSNTTPDIERTDQESMSSAEQLAADQIAAERLAAEQLAAEQLAAEQLAAEQLAAEQLAAEQLAAEQLAAEQLAAEQLAAEQLAAEQLAAEQLAAEQLAAEQLAAEQLAAEQLAAEQLAADQLAAEQRAAEQLAAEQLAAEQLAAEQLAAQAEKDRLARRAEIEQLQVATESQGKTDQQLEDAAATSRLTEAQQLRAAQAARVEAASSATAAALQTESSASRESIEQLAARQREDARRQRLARANATSASTQGNTQTDISAALVSEQQSGVTAEIEKVAAPITDDDIQVVYQRFRDLQLAIQARDIDTVIGLTKRSGIRIQQFLQVFENNVAIETRLGNIKMLKAAGEISATLRITRLERSDGTVSGPPLNLATVPLTSTRDDNGWSAIVW